MTENNFLEPNADGVQPSPTESDQAVPSQTEPDRAELTNWVTLDVVEKHFVDAGIPRTRALLTRYCRQGRLKGIKDAGPTGDEWYVDPQSIPFAIKELKRLNRDATASTEPDQAAPSLTEPDRAVSVETKADANQDDLPHAKGNSKKSPATKPSPTESDQAVPSQTEPDRARPSFTSDLEIYNHPYVHKLEKRVERLESDLREQVKITQTIQTESFNKIVDLQKMVQVGQSETLANYYLRAKNWLLGPILPRDDQSDFDEHKS